jgi:hypothetical protein
MMNEQKDLMEVARLWRETGWLTAVIGGAGMTARLLANPIQGTPWDSIRRILMAAIVSTIAWFIVEQIDGLSSLVKAITYGVAGVVAPELLEGVTTLAKRYAKNPGKLVKK